MSRARKAKQPVKYFGRLMSSVYSDKADELLRARGVVFERREKESGWSVFRFPESEIPKLPQDGPGPYIPVADDCGYSFWEMTDEEWNEP